MTPDQIKALRVRLRLNRRDFATAIGFAAGNGWSTVRKLERGDLTPTGTCLAAMRYLDAITSGLTNHDPNDRAGILVASLPPFMQGRYQ